MENRTVYTQASQASVLETNKVLRNTYSLLAITLAFSAVVAGISMALNLPHPGIIVSLIGMFGLMFLVNKTANSSAGILSTFAFTGFFGYMLGPIINMAVGVGGSEIVVTALGGTAIIFFSLSAYALTTKKDLSFMNGMIMAGALVAFVAMIANIFLAIPALSLAISALFMLVSSGFILLETQNIIRGGERNYILATVSLYVSLYNIFVSLLHLLMAFSGNDD